MRERFIMSQAVFTIKIVRKDGIKIISQAQKPLGAF
jgi:hypothetical protein